MLHHKLRIYTRTHKQRECSDVLRMKRQQVILNQKFSPAKLQSNVEGHVFFSSPKFHKKQQARKRLGISIEKHLGCDLSCYVSIYPTCLPHKTAAPVHHSNLSAHSISFMKTGCVLCHSSQFPV